MILRTSMLVVALLTLGLSPGPAVAATGSAERSMTVEGQSIGGIVLRLAVGVAKDVLNKREGSGLETETGWLDGIANRISDANVQLTIDGRPVEGIAAWAAAVNRVAGYALDRRTEGSVEYSYRLRIRGYDVRRSTRIENDHVVLTTSTGWTERIPITKKTIREVPIYVSFSIRADETDLQSVRIVGTATGTADTRGFQCGLVRRIAEQRSADELNTGLRDALQRIQRGGTELYTSGASDVLTAIHGAVQIGKRVRR